jgi:hypothetical protein
MIGPVASQLLSQHRYLYASGGTGNGGDPQTVGASSGPAPGIDSAVNNIAFLDVAQLEESEKKRSESAALSAEAQQDGRTKTQPVSLVQGLSGLSPERAAEYEGFTRAARAEQMTRIGSLDESEAAEKESTKTKRAETTAEESELQGADQKSRERSESLQGEERSEKKTPSSVKELSDQEEARVRELKRRDAEVRNHEMAHVAAGGSQVQGGANFEYEVGPDGKRYAVGGNVSIDTSPGETPEESLIRAQTIRRAAMAPANPSPQDRQVAAQAMGMETAARKELAAERREGAEQAQKQMEQEPTAAPPLSSTRPQTNRPEPTENRAPELKPNTGAAEQAESRFVFGNEAAALQRAENEEAAPMFGRNAGSTAGNIAATGASPAATGAVFIQPVGQSESNYKSDINRDIGAFVSIAKTAQAARVYENAVEAVSAKSGVNQYEPRYRMASGQSDKIEGSYRSGAPSGQTASLDTQI